MIVIDHGTPELFTCLIENGPKEQRFANERPQNKIIYSSECMDSLILKSRMRDSFDGAIHLDYQRSAIICDLNRNRFTILIKILCTFQWFKCGPSLH